MKQWRRLLFSIGMMAALVGCGTSDGNGADQAPQTAARLVGRVASIHEKDGFALVESFNDLALGEGLLLSTRGEGDRAATLVVSGERMGRYAAADLRGGVVQVGDAVYARPLIAPKDEISTELVPEIEENGGANP